MTRLPEPDLTVHTVGRNANHRAAEIQLGLLHHFGLTEETHLLEIGCGVGRLVYLLGDVLTSGSYVGFDIAPKAIAWLNENYAPLLPNFRFDLVELRNDRYNPKASASAESARFPYPDASFEMVCAFSIFTHMRLPEISHYLGEIRRVLAPTGTAVLTFYALARENENPCCGTDPGDPWVSLGDGVFTIAPDLPERGIGFDHDLIEATIAASGLELHEFVKGTWHGGPKPKGAFSHQDAFVLRH